MPSIEPGLDPAQAAERLERDGPNELRAQPTVPLWKLVLRQFESPLVLILVVAAVASGVLGDVPDGIAITVIVLLNAVIGFAQEQRAERAMTALRSMTAPRATVRRGGERRVIPAREVVVGDVLVLEAGDVVAADARICEAHLLSVNEAVLTGESMPVEKQVQAPDDPVPEALADRRGFVFMGTAVAGGSGEVVVVATGMQTEIGRIAELLTAESDQETPLQKRLAGVGRLLLGVCVVLVACVAGLGLLRGMGWEELFMSSVSLAVAAVPEGLPALITIALALGMQRMAAHKLLVRRLSAVETLGSVTVICTDKTGTLTTGIMEVREVWSFEGIDEEVLFAAAACCDAELGRAGVGDDGEDERSHDSGDTTELALLRAAQKRGIDRAQIEREQPRLEVTPFSPERRMMSIVRAGAQGAGAQGAGAKSSEPTIYVKGAVETLSEHLEPNWTARRAELLAQAETMASEGLRVLAIARGRGHEERDLELLGLIALADPPRASARAAIADARAAGVRTVMITGDHPVTAHAIARELGLIDAKTQPHEAKLLVRARTTAAQKTEIVRELRGTGEVVAMTGDGVNDAPAIREADVGLAMGASATEVTREASDIVLTDDDLSGVLMAIREGRVIYANIRKTIVYLLSGNFSELLLMLVAAALGFPFPLLPLQLLWINLVNETLPGLALIIDPPEDDVLKHPPRDPKAPLLGRPEWTFIAATAVLQASVGFGIYWWALEFTGHTLGEARSLAFMTVVSSGLLRAFAFRSETKLLWQVGALRNLALAGVVVGSLALQVGMNHVAPIRALFGLELLSWSELLLVAGFSLIPVSVLELGKLFGQMRAVIRRRGTPA
jgi:Ca2+-transporting ATPase